jgi:hypothetical protein
VAVLAGLIAQIAQIDLQDFELVALDLGEVSVLQ